MRLTITLILLAVSVPGIGQSFFRHIPPPQLRQFIIMDSVVTHPAATTMTAWRPMLNVASYAIPINSLVTGTGVSLQRLKWNKTKWTVQRSASLLFWYKSSLGGKGTAFAIGGNVGFWNNLILLGLGYTTSKWFGTVGPGVNLN